VRELDPFDASILNVLANVPATMEHVREQLLERLKQEGTPEGKAIARAILAPEGKKVGTSKDARVTAASLKRAVAAR
jgi:hypothetical protein